MLTLHQAVAFALTAAALIVIPGPSVLFVISRGVAFGRRVALATVLGNASGLLVHVAAVSLGLGALVARSLIVFTVMKLFGAGYLVLLGVRAFRHRRDLLKVGDPGRTVRSLRRAVADGFVVGVSNPKTTLFFLAVLPQFVEPRRGHVGGQLALLGLLFGAIALVSDSVYALAAGSIRAWLARRPERAARFGGASGFVLVGLGARLAFTGRTT